MAKVLVTGMSGTGKSTVLRLLGERGHRAVDTDDDAWSRWIVLPGGSRGWVWREDAIARLLAHHRVGHLFVGGCTSNQGRFYARFDHIALLSAPADVMLARVMARTDNPYGKDPAERAQILRNLGEVRPLLRASATLEIDASASLAHVLRELEDLAARGPVYGAPPTPSRSRNLSSTLRHIRV